MVDSVANELLGTLRDLLVEEVKFLSGVGDEVKKVESDLRIIHGLLMDADRKKCDSPTLQVWIAELKDLASKAENVLERYAVEVLSKRGKSIKKKLQRFIGILCECYSVHRAGKEIGVIRSRLAELTNKLSSVNEGSSNANHDEEEQQQRLLRLRYADEIVQHFVGMETDIDSVVSMLKDASRRSPSVISICGMGGLGKTTLARKIYHHQHVQGRFGGRRVWVCVTQQFEASTVLRQIFKQVDNNKAGIDGMELCDLVRELHSVLEEGEWLIVIDDIWESPHWAILKPAFPMNCKVLLTTRNENIEEVAFQEFRVHKLDFLSEDEGWELLRKIALPVNDDATADCSIVSKPMEDEGRLIAQRCGRLPLAISVIGGILRQKKQTLVEWKNVRSNIESYLKNGGGIGKDTKGIKLVLDLSFDVLPYYLKSCFLYLACFPEDYEIETEELYLLWLAEGLISCEERENGETLRDVAERYLTELAYRCMIQVEKESDDFRRRKFTRCRLHDLMRDLCTSKAVEKKFLKRMDFSSHQDDHGISSINRVALNPKESVYALSSCMMELKDLRSVLLVTKFYYTKVNAENVANILANSKYLKILVFRGIDFDSKKLPSVISKLVHIRYLGLNGCSVRELPQHVCYLPYINTLDLRVLVSMRVPNLIWKMKRLRHLFFSMDEGITVIEGDKLRLEGLNELETLEEISSETTCIADVASLTNLQLLSAVITDTGSLSEIVEFMISGNHCKLRETRLRLRSLEFGEDTTNVVKKMLMSPSLSRLAIYSCEIHECVWPCYEQGMCSNLAELSIISSTSKIGVMMEESGKYPILQSLELGNVRDIKDQMRFGANSFPELEFLGVYDFPDLTEWEVGQGAMPKLRKLVMYKCRKLEKLPDALRFIPTLRELKFINASSELRSRMKRGGEGEEDGEDYAKFSHIPNIVFDDF